jgi:hypothetical protein
MKIRAGFVSNSSSSSFVMIYKSEDDLYFAKDLEPMDKAVWDDIMRRSDNKTYIRQISVGGVDCVLRSAFGFESHHMDKEFQDQINEEAKEHGVKDFQFYIFPE